MAAARKNIAGRLIAGIVAGLVAVAAAGLGAQDSHAQFLAKDQRAKKAPAAKGPIQPLRKGPMANPALGPNRMAVQPRGPMHGPGVAPQNARVGPGFQNQKSFNPGANFRGPGAGNALNRGANVPGARSANFGPNNRFGAGNRFGSQPRGFTHRAPHLRAVNAGTPQLRQVQRFTHRTEMFAWRNRMPRYPLPGERNFTGVPPAGETRFAAAEMVCQWGADITPQRIDEIARQHDLTVLAIHRSALTGGTLVQFRINGNRQTAVVVRAMEAEQIVSQPNYVYLLGQTAPETAAAESGAGDSQQYVANKLRLAQVHKIATGKGVIIAVIDSEIDNAHPELASGIAEKFDAVGQPDQPHTHGTGMAGAIVARGRLIGVAPGATALAVHAFSTGGQQQSPQATTRHIVAGIDWALNKGARIINMSFAGPYDPMLALALKNAYAKGAILIAAVGNQGPKSPPLYPAADAHVIGVTAIDENDKLYKGSNIGQQVAIAAPGVDVMVPAPAEAYQITTGTSVAAAHVSGVAALLLERHPNADAQLILEALTASATRLGANKRDDKVGWGLIDPLAALNELDARRADAKVAGTTPAPTATQAATPARAPAVAPTPAAVTTRPALPRPGLYLPKQ